MKSSPVGFDSPNYAYTYAGGTLTVMPAPLTVTAEDKIKVYGASLPVFTVIVNGLVNGDTVEKLGQVIFDCNAKPTSPVGNYVVVPGRSELTELYLQLGER